MFTIKLNGEHYSNCVFLKAYLLLGPDQLHLKHRSVFLLHAFS